MIENLASLRAQFATHPPKLSSNFDNEDPHKLKHLSLEQQKKRAKDLLCEWHSGSDEKRRDSKLSDAQHVIATGYGFKNWATLKAHITQAQLARDAIDNGEPSSLDAGRRVLHIRCGNDIQHAMAVAGFSGDFLVFPDPYVHGPVPETGTLKEFIHIRATYISSDLKPPYEEVYESLTQDYSDLEKSLDYDAVYLWFEHDSYDQLTVAKLLDFYSDSAMRPPMLKIINITHFPGVKIFNGIGQLPPEAMRVLWDEFTDVTKEQLAIGKKAWAAVRSPTPLLMQSLIAAGTPELPTMAIALDRHLKQLPSMRNGLNLTENLVLQILDEKGEMNAGRMFGWYTNHYEPLTFMGDTSFWNILDELAGVEHPAITQDKQGAKPNQWQLALTPTGRDLLVNKSDWLTLNTIDRWVGGIHIDTLAGHIYRVDA